MQTNTSPSKATKPEPGKPTCNSTGSGLRRLKPGPDRGVPEGMEDESQDTKTKTNKTKDEQQGSTTKTDKTKTKEIKDDLSLIYLDIDTGVNQNSTDEVLIKRAWSLRDLFKRNASTGSTHANPQVINQ